MQELRGLPVANAIIDKLREDILYLNNKGILPTLAIVRVGARADDLTYESSIVKNFLLSAQMFK
jgi:methylenetetrahydrofolate dehydrogenase (NADP+)/methenyltetrahydrofolate cyclohydrolase